VKAGEGGSGGWNGAEEKRKEGTQLGREGRNSFAHCWHDISFLMRKGKQV